MIYSAHGRNHKSEIGSFSLSQRNNIRSLSDGLTFLYVDRYYGAFAVGIDVVLHLHSLEDSDGLSLADSVAYLHLDVEDDTGEGSLDASTTSCCGAWSS